MNTYGHSNTTKARTRIKKGTLVLGVGNPLQRDDGLGVRVVELLAQHDLPTDIWLEDIGTPGLGLALWIEGWSRVILIDAVQMGQPPGTWRRFNPKDVLLLADGDHLSLHQSNLADGLALAKALKKIPDEMILFGMEPERISWGIGLSPSVEAALPGLLENLLVEFEKR